MRVDTSVGRLFIAGAAGCLALSLWSGPARADAWTAPGTPQVLAEYGDGPVVAGLDLRANPGRCKMLDRAFVEQSLPPERRARLAQMLIAADPSLWRVQLRLRPICFDGRPVYDAVQLTRPVATSASGGSGDPARGSIQTQTGIVIELEDQ